MRKSPGESRDAVPARTPMTVPAVPGAADVLPQLLSWYAARARDLPWRREPDPYRVWVSEVMLQQTRVDAVIPYYNAWLRRFPTLDALAAADQDAVLKAWEGLGYYSRARNLRRAARLVRERHGGALPRDLDALRALPGIGDYTAGAIASIAFGIPAPAIDGNARRVLCRLFDLSDPSPAELRGRAASLVPAEHPGDFNQALMELGATLCTFRAPSCDACPLAAACVARARGTQLLRPTPKRAAAVPEENVGTAVLRAPSGHLLLVRRPDEGLLAGLWEFPGAAVAPGESARAAAARALLAVLDGDVGDGETLGSVTHAFSHLRVAYHAFRFRAEGIARPAGSARAAWILPGELPALAIPVAQRRIAALAGH